MVSLVVGFRGVKVNVVEVKKHAGAFCKCDHFAVGGGASSEIIHVAADWGGGVLCAGGGVDVRECYSSTWFRWVASVVAVVVGLVAGWCVG